MYVEKADVDRREWKRQDQVTKEELIAKHFNRNEKEVQ